MSSTPITITNPAVAGLLGEARFFSVTYRLFKLASGRLEATSEDYGQLAVYRGTLHECLHAYQLDSSHRFEKGRPVAVCGNTAVLVR